MSPIRTVAEGLDSRGCIRKCAPMNRVSSYTMMMAESEFCGNSTKVWIWHAWAYPFKLIRAMLWFGPFNSSELLNIPKNRSSYQGVGETRQYTLPRCSNFARCPPQSLDFNTIEIWGAKLKETAGIWIHYHRISTNWTELFISVGVRFLASPFYNSVPRIIAAESRTKGGPTKYWCGDHNNLLRHLQLVILALRWYACETVFPSAHIDVTSPTNSIAIDISFSPDSCSERFLHIHMLNKIKTLLIMWHVDWP